MSDSIKDISASISKNKTNYMEYVLYDSKIFSEDGKSLYKGKINQDIYKKLKFHYNKFKNNDLKFFIKSYRNYIYNGVEYTIYNDSDHSIMIYNKHLYDFQDLNDITSTTITDPTVVDTNDYKRFNFFKSSNVYIANYSKSNLSHALFNWNNKLNNIIDVNRMTFIYKGKIYVNFETHKYPDDEKKYYSIYINFSYNNLIDYNKKYNLLIELDDLLNN